MLFVCVLTLYLLFTMALCLAARKGRSGDFQDHLTAKHSVGFWVITGNAAAVHIGSGFVIGGAESGAMYGVSGAWYGLGCALSVLLAGMTVARFAYRHGYVTLSDYFKARYGDNRAVVIYSLATAAACIAVMSAQILAGKAMFQAFGLDGDWGVWLTAAVVLVYATFFGLRGTYLVSAVHVCVIAAGLAAMSLGLAGEISEAWNAMPEGYHSLGALGGSDTVMYVLPTLLASLVSQSYFQRAASARSERVLTGGHIAAGALLIPLAVLPVLVGIVGAFRFPDTPEAALFFQVLLQKTPPVFSALLISAFISVIMSACGGSLLCISATLVHDVYHGILRPEASDARCITLSHAVNVGTCLLAVNLALAFQNIVEILSVSYTLISACCLVPLLGGLFWKKGNSAGVLWSAAAGGITTVLISSGLLPLPYGSVIPLVPSAAGYWLGSKSRREKQLTC